MAARKKQSQVSVDKILEMYETEGATPAAKMAKVSKRTVQRWASDAGMKSGFDPASRITTTCPSSAEYGRGCRCDGCKEAQREAQRAVKQRRIKRARTGRVQIPHGVSGYSNWDCRCPTCRGAWSQYLRSRRASRRTTFSEGGDSQE